MKKSLIFIVGVLFMVGFVSGFIEPPYIPVVKPTGGTTWTVCASGCDFIDLEDADGVVGPGAIIRIKAGTYAPTNWNSAGTSGNEIVIEAFGDGDAIIEGAGSNSFHIYGDYTIWDGGPNRELIFDGSGMENNAYFLQIQLPSTDVTLSRLEVRNTAYDNDPQSGGININIFGQNARVYNSEIHNSGSAGIYGQNGNNAQIKNNIVRDNRGSGIQLNPHGGYSMNTTTISGNLIYNNGFTSSAGFRPGLTVLSNDDALYNVYIYNNIIWNNKKSGISAGSGSNENTKIWSNTVYNNVDEGVKFFDGGTMDIKNNIVYNNGGNNWYCDTQFCMGGTSESNNLITDPNFLSTDPLSDDFLKISSTSPAADQGYDLSGIVNDDYFGTLRPQDGNNDGTAEFDIGAYEYLSSCAPIHPADLDCDDLIDITELMTYINLWKNNEVGVTISTLFDALVIWKTG